MVAPFDGDGHMTALPGLSRRRLSATVCPALPRPTAKRHEEGRGSFVDNAQRCGQGDLGEEKRSGRTRRRWTTPGKSPVRVRLAPGELQREVAGLEATVAHEHALAAERLAAVERANERASAAFKALSGEALKDASTHLVELATAKFGELRTETRGELEAREKAIEQIVGRVSESLTQVDSKLETLDRDRREAQGALQQHLRAVIEGQEQLRAETGSLVSALRKPDVRGRWGEMQLRRVVELAGMTEYCDFIRQPSIDGDEGRLRPDLVVRMPGGKKVVVDAKVPLESYLDAHGADDPAERAMHLADRAGAGARTARGTTACAAAGCAAGRTASLVPRRSATDEPDEAPEHRTPKRPILDL
jgi:hypothetical protein